MDQVCLEVKRPEIGTMRRKAAFIATWTGPRTTFNARACFEIAVLFLRESPAVVSESVTVALANP